MEVFMNVLNTIQIEGVAGTFKVGLSPYYDCYSCTYQGKSWSKNECGVASYVE